MKGNYFQKSSEKLAVIYYEGKPTFQKLYNPFFKAVVSLANTYGGKIILLKKIVGKGESKTKYVPIPHFHLRECEEVLVHDIMPYIGSIMNHNPITEYKKIPLDEKQQEYRIEINVENYIDGLLAYEDKNHRKTEYYRDSEGHIFPISSQGKTKDLEIKIITNKIKQNSLQKVGIHDYNLINADEPITSAYKYMTLDVFLSCLKYGTIRMQEPTNWKDQYEGRFYNAKYDNITNSNLPRLYATCITANPASEAAWKVYAHGTGLGARCVQIKINMEKLRKQLCNGQNGTYYEGKVFYDLTDSEIDHLHETGAHYHSLFFSNFNTDMFVRLMLIKRQAYQYENETRLFLINPPIVPDKPTDHHDVRVDWKEIIEEIRIDHSCTPTERLVLEMLCKEKKIKVKMPSKKGPRAKDEIPVTEVNIDRMKGKKKIKIQKV